MNVTVIDEQDRAVDIEKLRDLAVRVIRHERYPSDTEVDMLLADSTAMTAYNAEHLGRSGPTDVLAFPLDDRVPGRPPVRQSDGPPVHLGDIVICPAYVADQAAKADVTESDEMSLMVVHGVLHLMGYDHQEGPDAARMEAHERDILAAVGVVRR